MTHNINVICTFNVQNESNTDMNEGTENERSMETKKNNNNIEMPRYKGEEIFRQYWSCKINVYYNF